MQMEGNIESYLQQITELKDREVLAYQNLYSKINDITSLREKVRQGFAVYPLNVYSIGFDRLGQVIVEIEKVAYWPRMLSKGSPGRVYAVNSEEFANVTIGKLGYDKVELIVDADDIPDWVKGSKLALLVRPDDRSFREMERALAELSDKKNENFRSVFRIAYGLEKQEVISEPFINTELNSSQLRAVQQIIGENKVVVVHGPPGTGKTTTLVKAIIELLKQNKRILVATPSNAAADHMTKSLLGFTKKVVRVGNIARVDDDLEKHTLAMKVQVSEEAQLIKEYQKELNKVLKQANSFKRNFGHDERQERRNLRSEVKLYRKQIKELEKFSYERILSQSRIAVGTLIGLCRTEIKAQNWDVVVIDEAAQAFEPACWAVASFGSRLILAGDHKQLPPTLMQQFSVKKPYQTLQEKIVEKNSDTVTFLDTQYRMDSIIKEFSNQQFYEGKLKSEIDASLSIDEPLVFIDTAGCGFDEELQDGSRFNSGETNLVQKMIGVFSNEFNSIGVISPYSVQVKHLRDELKEVILEKDIQTIDGFQGQERELIIISLVRSNTDGTIGFLKDYRRMNVALTRAKKKLIVIGDSATIGMDSFYNDFLSYVENQGTYKSAWEFS
jgi:ATP-dependent RNA/DNA helicase IGHMBP2